MLIDPLLALPANLRSRLTKSLTAGVLEPPYTAVAVRAALAVPRGYDAAELAATLTALDKQGVSGAAVAMSMDIADRSTAAADRPDLVWSGPTVPGIHTRSTRQVYEELISVAEREVWISTYAYFDGQQAFKSLAERMEAVSGLRVRLLLNIPRRYGDQMPATDLLARFADRFWNRDWPSTERPDVYYDPRSIELVDAVHGVLHAKAIVIDDSAAFITSANLTEAAFDHNIEVGILTRDAQIATSLARHFRLLIDHGRLERLPG